MHELESVRAQECVACFTNSIVVDELGNNIGRFSSNVKNRFGKKYLLKDGNFLQTSSMLYKKKFQNFFFPREGPFIDFLLYVKLINFGDFCFIDEELSVYRNESDGSISKNQSSEVNRLYCLALAEQNINTSWVFILLQSYANLLFRIFASCLIKNNFKNFFQIIGQISKDRGFIFTFTVFIMLSLIIFRRLICKIKNKLFRVKKIEVVFYKK